MSKKSIDKFYHKSLNSLNLHNLIGLVMVILLPALALLLTNSFGSYAKTINKNEARETWAAQKRRPTSPKKSKAPFQKQDSSAPCTLYSRLIIREAILQDQLMELQKASFYLSKGSQPKRDHRAEKLSSLLDRLDRIDELLQIQKPTPDYDYLNLSKVDKLLTEAEELAHSLAKPPFLELAKPDPSLPPILFGLQIAKNREIYQPDSPLLDLIPLYGFDFLSPHPRSLNQTMTEANPQKGTYDFDKLRKISQTIADHDLSLRLQVNDSGFQNLTGYWLQKETDETSWRNSRLETQSLKKAHSALNIWNPKVVQWVTDYASYLAQFMKNNPSIAVYELFNEPVMRLNNHPVGYDRYAQAAFQAFLKDQYKGEINRLNLSWGKKYQSFEKIVPPPDLVPEPDPAKTAQLYDFSLFREQSYISYFNRIIQAIKAKDPQTPVCSQFFERLMKREAKKGNEAVGRGIDFYGLAKLDWDILGNHDWPYQKEAVDLLYTYCINRYTNHQIWNDEFIWTAWEGFSEKSVISNNQKFINQGEVLMRRVLARNIWRHLAWSRNGLIFYNLDHHWPGWNNTLLNPQANTLAMRYCSGIIPVLKNKALQMASYLSFSQVENGGLYLLHSQITDLLSFPFQTSISLAHDLISDFLNQGLIPFIVPEAALLDGREDLKKCKVLICPYTTHMDQDSVRKILAWVKEGGHIILIGPAGRYNQSGQDMDGLVKTLFHLQPTYSKDKDMWLVNDQPMTELQATFGQGRAKLLPLKDYQGLKPLLFKEIEPYRSLFCDQPDFELIPKITIKGEKILIVTNLNPTEVKKGRITIKGSSKKVSDLSVHQGMEVPVSSDGKSMTLTVQLPPGDGSVLLIR